MTNTTRPCKSSKKKSVTSGIINGVCLEQIKVRRKDVGGNPDKPEGEREPGQGAGSWRRWGDPGGPPGRAAGTHSSSSASTLDSCGGVASLVWPAPSQDAKGAQEACPQVTQTPRDTSEKRWRKAKRRSGLSRPFNEGPLCFLKEKKCGLELTVHLFVSHEVTKRQGFLSQLTFALRVHDQPVPSAPKRAEFHELRLSPLPSLLQRGPPTTGDAPVLVIQGGREGKW